MNKHLGSGNRVALFVLAASGIVAQPAYGATVTKNNNLTLADSQISHNTFSNDVWNSGLIDVGLVTLMTNDSLQLNITFDKKLELDDGFFNGNESIHIDVQGVGGVGGAPNNKADFTFEFTGVDGNILVNPVTGTAGQVALNGNVNHDQDVDLINGGKMTFTDVHLKLTNKNPNNWSIGKVGVGVDADDVNVRNVNPVPVPPALPLLGGALTALGLLRRMGGSKPA